MRPSSWSLQRRLVAGLLAVTAVGLLSATVVSNVLIRDYLVDRIDEQLTAGLPRTSSSQELPPRLPDADADSAGLELPSSFVLTIVGPDGSVVDQVGGSLVDDQGPPDVSALTTDEVVALDGQIVTLQSVDGGAAYRAKAEPGPADNSLVVAVSLAPVNSTVRQLAVTGVLVGLLVLLLIAVVARSVVRVGLRPLDDVEETADAIAAGDLGARVPEGAPGTEVGRLATALNAMLGQIESAFDEREASEARLRRFIADASHELRTPLTSIRGYAELARQGALDGPASRDQAMRRIENEADRMGGLVDDLLLLARLDQQRPLEREPVDLVELGAQTVADARAQAPDRMITWTSDHAAGGLLVSGDGDRLRQVLVNLVTNALVHTSGSISVTLASADDRAVVEVSDQGPGMPPEAAALVFERFYRGDPARARGGSGLGLSIVDSVVRAHGGSVTCTSSPDAGTTFTVRLPLDGAEPTLD